MHKAVWRLLLCCFSAVIFSPHFFNSRLMMAWQSDTAFWETRTMAINSWRFSFTMSHCLAIRRVGGSSCNTSELLGYEHWAFFWEKKGKLRHQGKIDRVVMNYEKLMGGKRGRGEGENSLVSGNFPRSLDGEALWFFSSRSVKSEPRLY